ncbi:MAG: protein translocase subunit SecD [Proteobacteria bacterium]|nr:protein translocase subunit SecD [Pseudomonadota bacterium]
MRRSIQWRAGLILCFLALSILFLTPTLIDPLPQWWRKVLPVEKIHLGLDLRGGMHLLLEVEVQKAVESAMDKYASDIKDTLTKKDISFQQVERNSAGKISVLLTDTKANDRFNLIRSDQFANLKVASFLEREGKYQYLLELNPKEVKSIEDSAIRQGLETIRNRIDQFGVTEPAIAPQGENQILIQLPGVKDPQRAIELIGRTALLEFKLVDEENSLEEALKGNMPPGSEILYQKVTDKERGVVTRRPFLLKKRALMTGDVLTDARTRIKSDFNEPYVSIDFDARGARLFDQITAENVKKRLAIVLDNNVYSAPVIQERISGGKAQISGSFTPDEASDLAIVLRAGALPAPVKIIQNVTVGPSLGQDSIDKGIRAAIIGAVLVVVFMAVYYGFSGVIADWALVLNIVYLMGALASMRATLTLPGIAGIILAIGMAVDSNVLMFERIREELRQGKTVRAAVDAGYDKALFTIIDSHVTTLITAVVLFQFGTGPIKGFAVTLSLGVMINLFSALIGTKVIFDWINFKKQLKTLSI